LAISEAALAVHASQSAATEHMTTLAIIIEWI
jgi:hypothetical protein